jgi:hypothetical protein
LSSASCYRYHRQASYNSADSIGSDIQLHSIAQCLHCSRAAALLLTIVVVTVLTLPTASRAPQPLSAGVMPRHDTLLKLSNNDMIQY